MPEKTSPSRWVSDRTLQETICHKTGVRFFTMLDGRFKNLPTDQVQSRITEACRVLSEVPDIMLTLDEDLPPGEQLEHLMNIVDFELNPPCGCVCNLNETVRRGLEGLKNDVYRGMLEVNLDL